LKLAGTDLGGRVAARTTVTRHSDVERSAVAPGAAAARLVAEHNTMAVRPTIASPR